VIHLPHWWLRSRQHGVAGSRQHALDDGCVLDDGVVSCQGCVDGRPGKVNALISVRKMCWQKMEAVTSRACANGVRPFVLSA
jgi:hypothetical protein